METREREQHSPGPAFENNKPSSLKISDPNDVREAEADRVADKVMLMPDVRHSEPKIIPSVEPMMQRKHSDTDSSLMIQLEEEEDTDMLQMKPDTQKQGITGDPNDNNNHSDIQLKATSNNSDQYASQEIQSRLNNTSGNGESLPPLVQREMESKMGQDFSKVNIHNDSSANQMSKELQAKAFTHGSNIYFKSGEYNPQSSSGKKLLAHELTHTVQQNATTNLDRDKHIQRTGEEDVSSEITLSDELEATRQALATIHSELSTGLFDWRINESEAHRVFVLLQELEPSVLLRVIQTMRLTDRGERFYRALSEEDRLSFDQFATVFGTDTGYLAYGDIIQIEVYATSRQPEPEFSLDLSVDAEGIRPFFLTENIHVVNLLPQQAVERLVEAYHEQQIFVEPRIRLRLVERGSAYAPRHGRTSISIWYEAIDSLSSEEWLMMDKRQQFLDYIHVVDISRNPTITNASLRYLDWISENYNSEEFLERTPADLWSWALEQASRPLPESPVQPFLSLYRQMSNRLDYASDDERTVLQGALSRFLDWIDQHMEDENISSYDPVEIWTSCYSRSFDLQLSALRERSYERLLEEQRREEDVRTSAARQERWEEYFSTAMQLWGYSSRAFPYLIPVPSEGRDILVTGHPARQAVLDRLAEELMDWATDNMFSEQFLTQTPAGVLVELLDQGYGELLDETARIPLESESIDRHELLPGRVLASFGETVGIGLLVIAVAGAAVGAGIPALVVGGILLAAAGTMGVMSYLQRREEIESENYDVPVPLSMMHAAGDVVGLSQLIEGITGERLGTGRRLESIERSEELGSGAGGILLLLLGSKAYRYGQVRGQRFRLSRRGSLPPGPEGAEIPNPQDTPPVDISRTAPYETPGPTETAVRNALDQNLRAGFDEWMAEIRNNGGDPEAVLNRMPGARRIDIARRRAEDFTQQFLERLRQEQIRIRSMDNPLNPQMRVVEQAIPGEDSVLVMYNEHPPEPHEIQQAIQLFRRTGEPVRLFGDTASGRQYPGIDGTIGSPPRPLSLKHGNAAAHPNFARFQAEEALIRARDNGYTHVEVQIEMEGKTIAEIQSAWEGPSMRPGQTAPRPVFDSTGTVSRIEITGTDGTWVIEPPLEGPGMPGFIIPLPDSDEDSEIQRKELQSEYQNNSSYTSKGIQNEINNTSGNGESLPPLVQREMESKMGQDFSKVSIHNDSSSHQMSKELQAKAFTHGSDIYFKTGEYNPQSEGGKRLLAHELTHTIQQKSNGSIQRKNDENKYWDIAVRGRELSTVPSEFNYEIVKDRLIAHITDTQQVEEVIKLLEVLHLYQGVTINKDEKRKQLNQQLIKTPNTLDITEHLPKEIKIYLQNLHKLSLSVLKYGKELGKGQKVVTPTTIKAEMIKQGKSKDEIEEAQREWRANFYSKAASWEEFVSVCHAFVALVISGSKSGVSPLSDADYSKTISEGDSISDAFNQSVKGKGPYRKVPRKDVQIGDIAVFRSGKIIYGEDDLETGRRSISINWGETVHSAMVIKVTGISYSKIEVLEKKNPWETFGTRTVQQILDKYKSDKVFVTFIAPTLSGMPYKIKSNLGLQKPSEPFAVENKIGPENTYILFKTNTDITLPHEDEKLFEFIARNKTNPVRFRVHGYASIEGSKKYNLNLSAHRAIQTKNALLKHLPAKSSGEVVAHGETEDFGSLKQNRRVGIEIITK